MGLDVDMLAISGRAVEGSLIGRLGAILAACVGQQVAVKPDSAVAVGIAEALAVCEDLVGLTVGGFSEEDFIVGGEERSPAFALDASLLRIIGGECERVLPDLNAADIGRSGALRVARMVQEDIRVLHPVDLPAGLFKVAVVDGKTVGVRPDTNCPLGLEVTQVRLEHAAPDLVIELLPILGSTGSGREEDGRVVVVQKAASLDEISVEVVIACGNGEDADIDVRVALTTWALSPEVEVPPDTVCGPGYLESPVGITDLHLLEDGVGDVATVLACPLPEDTLAFTPSAAGNVDVVERRVAGIDDPMFTVTCGNPGVRTFALDDAVVG